MQFHAGWTLQQARAQLGYLAALGISDLYASPLLLARPGSTHGYDVCDPSRLNPELGTEHDWAALQAELQRLGMSLVLDIVPNHMGVGHHANRWWWDTLQLGERSPYARHFDIAWDAGGRAGQVELPVLGRPLDECLAAAEIQVRLTENAFVLAYYDRLFPLSPETWRILLEQPDPPLSLDLDSMEKDLHAWSGGNMEAGSNVRERLRRWQVDHPGEREAMIRRLDLLHRPPGSDVAELLSRQHYRLSFWREGRANYRRFFDVTDLAALRVEDPDVFEAAHSRILDWVARGEVSGLRVDHPDGLLDPKAYFLRLQAACLARRHDDPESWPGETERLLTDLQRGTGSPPFYVVGEKILSEGEVLPSCWCLHGTTGYEFLNETNGLFVSAQGCQALSGVYERFTGRTPDFITVAHQGKRDVLDAHFPGELDALATRLHALAEPSFDGTRVEDWRRVLREWIVALPVYRTYLSLTHVEPSPAEREQIDTATRLAIASSPKLPATMFTFLKALMHPGDAAWAEVQGNVLDIVMRLQQLTGPATAKGVEDTAFYRHYRLVSLNEVGGEPGRDGVSMEAFHAFQEDRALRWPHAMSCTATHDTKRGEDVRARLNVLSEIPQAWEETVTSWARANAGRKTMVQDRPAPSANDEYLLYQTLVGAWPAGVAATAMPEDFKRRIADYMTKAIKESKCETSWIDPNEAYESATRQFAEAILDADKFREQMVSFSARLARAGVVNSLAQVLIKLTAPGVPDLYQGTELWDLSMVDPDNRRPVDYAARRSLLEDLQRQWTGLPESRETWLRELLEQWPDGRIKMFTLWRALQCRREYGEAMSKASYLRLETAGTRAANLCAFARAHGGRMLLTVVPRCASDLLEDPGPVCFREDAWEDTSVLLSQGLAQCAWTNTFTGGEVQATNGTLRATDILSSFPVALLSGVCL